MSWLTEQGAPGWQQNKDASTPGRAQNGHRWCPPRWTNTAVVADLADPLHPDPSTSLSFTAVWCHNHIISGPPPPQKKRPILPLLSGSEFKETLINDYETWSQKKSDGYVLTPISVHPPGVYGWHLTLSVHICIQLLLYHSLVWTELNASIIIICVNVLYYAPCTGAGHAHSDLVSCCLIDWWSLIQRYSPLSRADSLRSHVILHEWLAFYCAFFEYPPKWCTYSAGMAGAT